MGVYLDPESRLTGRGGGIAGFGGYRLVWAHAKTVVTSYTFSEKDYFCTLSPVSYVVPHTVERRIIWAFQRYAVRLLNPSTAQMATI